MLSISLTTLVLTTCIFRWGKQIIGEVFAGQNNALAIIYIHNCQELPLCQNVPDCQNLINHIWQISIILIVQLSITQFDVRLGTFITLLLLHNEGSVRSGHSTLKQEQSMTSQLGTLQGRSPGLYSNDEINQSDLVTVQIVNMANQPTRPSANTQ